MRSEVISSILFVVMAVLWCSPVDSAMEPIRINRGKDENNNGWTTDDNNYVMNTSNECFTFESMSSTVGGYSIVKDFHTENITQCLTHCMGTPKCRSVDYRYHDHRCALKSSTKFRFVPGSRWTGYLLKDNPNCRIITTTTIPTTTPLPLPRSLYVMFSIGGTTHMTAQHFQVMKQFYLSWIESVQISESQLQILLYSYVVNGYWSRNFNRIQSKEQYIASINEMFKNLQPRSEYSGLSIMLQDIWNIYTTKEYGANPGGNKKRVVTYFLSGNDRGCNDDFNRQKLEELFNENIYPIFVLLNFNNNLDLDTLFDKLKILNYGIVVRMESPDQLRNFGPALNFILSKIEKGELPLIKPDYAKIYDLIGWYVPKKRMY